MRPPPGLRPGNCMTMKEHGTPGTRRSILRCSSGPSRTISAHSRSTGHRARRSTAAPCHNPQAPLTAIAHLRPDVARRLSPPRTTVPVVIIWNFASGKPSVVHIPCRDIGTRRNRNGRKHHKSGNRRPYRAPDPEPYQGRDDVSSRRGDGGDMDLRRREDASASPAGRSRLVHCGDSPAGPWSGWRLKPQKGPQGDGKTQTRSGGKTPGWAQQKFTGNPT